MIAWPISGVLRRAWHGVRAARWEAIARRRRTMRHVVRGFVFALVAAQIAAPALASHGVMRNIADTVGNNPLAHAVVYHVADTVGNNPLARVGVRQIADTVGNNPLAHVAVRQVADTVGNNPLFHASVRQVADTVGN